MAKRQFQLTEEQASVLMAAYLNCKDGATRTRFQAVRLYGTGYPTKEVMEITGCNRSCLMDWCRQYRVDRTAGLIDKRVGGNHRYLSPAQIASLEVRLRQYTPEQLFGDQAFSPDGRFWTVEDLQRAMAQWYGVIYKSRSSYYDLLARCGFSYQRPAKVFKSRRLAKVAEFEEQLEKK
jgi:transposase